MKLSDKMNGAFYAVILVIVSNLILQNDWGITLFVVGVFAIGGLIWQPLITFMSNNTENYK